MQIEIFREEINTLEMKVTDQLIASKNIKVGDSLDLKTLAPRKVDWDLRRGISDKLEKLDRRTQKAVTQLISILE
jgi:coiled-coil domain-containing protein 12